MKAINKFYKLDNYTIQQSVSLENKLYESLKDIISNNYDATISQVINACVEDLINSKTLDYYHKPYGEITVYRSIMMRKNNISGLKEIQKKTGISYTRLINSAIKQFIDNFNKK